MDAADRAAFVSMLTGAFDLDGATARDALGEVMGGAPIHVPTAHAVMTVFMSAAYGEAIADPPDPEGLAILVHVLSTTGALATALGIDDLLSLIKDVLPDLAEMMAAEEGA